MRKASRVVAIVLEGIRELIRPGVSTLELDIWAEERIRRENALPAFKGYRRGLKVFPATLCTSINNEVVHGIPSRERVLRDGDIVSVDVGAVYDGYFGDGARTYAVGEIDEEAQRLLDVCQQSLLAGIKMALVNNHLNQISNAIDQFVRAAGFEIIRDLSGHGIGRNLHEEPEILNFFQSRKGPLLKENMTFAIEPMITNGSYQVKTAPDGWTVLTADGSLSAHFENTIAITANGPEILTRL
jgi:methionyl aminopeptidase